jgi:hypothetical protein
MARETRAIWAKRVKRWRRSGLGAVEFAEREGLKAKTLWWWSWRLEREREAPARPAFVEVVSTAAAAGGSAGSNALEVMVGDARVAVPVGFDEATLRRLLRVVEGR